MVIERLKTVTEVEEDDDGERLFMIARLEDDTIDRIAQRVIELLERGAWLSDEINR